MKSFVVVVEVSWEKMKSFRRDRAGEEVALTQEQARDDLNVWIGRWQLAEGKIRPKTKARLNSVEATPGLYHNNHNRYRQADLHKEIEKT